VLTGSELKTFLGMPAIVCSAAMRQLLELVERIAQTNAAVLITGESGSGKELIARAIHHYSLRGSKPWVDVSCAALPEHLVESELFGYERSAFIGADYPKPGLFELANHGTLFLDEIGELEPRMQVKLLRVLDGVPYYRLGGVRKVAVDVRIVAATSRDLRAEVAAGGFRGAAGTDRGHCALGGVLPEADQSTLVFLRRGVARAATVQLAGQCSRAAQCRN
jgi:transcriptional regulator with GAF, ATPase, and Fis domain